EKDNWKRSTSWWMDTEDLAELLPGVSEQSHEIFVQDTRASFQHLLAMPRTDVHAWLLVSPEAVFGDTFNEGILDTDCHKKARYTIHKVAADQPATLILKKDPTSETVLCHSQWIERLPSFPKTLTVQEDLTKNTALINVNGSTPMRKISTINSDWERLTRQDGPPKLLMPVAYPTETGFLLWGKNIDSETFYAAHYDHEEETWTRLFGMDGAPTSDSVLSHDWDRGILYVMSRTGLSTFDPETLSWSTP